MSKFAKLYNKVFDYSLQKGKHVTFKDMLNYRAHVNVMIPHTTKYIYNELPIRLAKRVLDLNNLPFGLAKSHSINVVRELYLNSFEELNNIPEPKTDDDIIKFKNVIENIYVEHSTILSTMSMGLNDLHNANKIYEIEEPHMQLFLNNFHTNRCEMRLFLEQYIAFFEKARGDNFYGIINLETNIEEIIHNSISDIQFLCDTHKLDLSLDDIIRVDNKGQGKITIPTVEHYLFYVFFEIIKNSIEAIKHNKNPYIEITINDIDVNWVLVKISDKQNRDCSQLVTISKN